MRNTVDRVQKQILEFIRGRKLPEQSILPSLRTLEKEFGCSLQTIHQAVTNLAEFGVLESIPRRGYRLRNAPLAGDLLKSIADLQIAFLLPSWVEGGVAAGSAYSEILAGAEAAIPPQNNINLIYLSLPWKLEEKEFSMERLGLKRRKIAGIMLTGPTPDFISEKLIEKSWVPVVLVDNTSNLPNTVSVSQDNLSASARAVRYLYEHGHRRIGMIGSTAEKFHLNERYAGFMAETSRLNLTGQIPFLEMADSEQDTVTGGGMIAERLLKKGFSGATAVFFQNDSMALGAMRVFQNAGIKIPDDLSVIAIGGDARFSELFKPSLTTFSLDSRLLGNFALEALLEKMRKPKSMGRSILLPLELREGKSVRSVEPDGKG